MKRIGAVLSVVLVLVLVGGLGVPVSAQDLNCGDFGGDQAAAQAYFESGGGSPSFNFNDLDRNRDGIACESPGGDVVQPVEPVEPVQPPEPAQPDEPTPPVEPVEPVERDPAACGDFATQPDAQAALDTGRADPENLDLDGDGVACEELPGGEGDAADGASVTVCESTGGESTGPVLRTREEIDARIAAGDTPLYPDENGDCPGIRVVPNVCSLTAAGAYEHVVVQPERLEAHLAANPDDFERNFYDGPCPILPPDDPDDDDDDDDGRPVPTAAPTDRVTPTGPTVIEVRSESGSPARGGSGRSERIALQGIGDAVAIPDEIPADATEARVERVVNGDTVEVEITEAGHPEEGETRAVRLLLIDAPEARHPIQGAECFGPEATARTKRMLPAGRTVYLERDVSDVDRNDRLLRYVWFEGRRDGRAYLANELLVRDGYAVLTTPRGDVAHLNALRAAQRQAVAVEAGLWAACGGADAPLAAAEPERASVRAAQAEPAPQGDTVSGNPLFARLGGTRDAFEAIYGEPLAGTSDDYRVEGFGPLLGVTYFGDRVVGVSFFADRDLEAEVLTVPHEADWTVAEALAIAGRFAPADAELGARRPSDIGNLLVDGASEALAGALGPGAYEYVGADGEPGELQVALYLDDVGEVFAVDVVLRGVVD